MKAKTYGSAKGAKAAAKKAGLDTELVAIIEVQTDDGVRYSYTQATSEGEAMEEGRDDALAEPVVTTAAPAAKPKREPTPNVERIEQNGVKRPKDGGLCAAVWAWLDENGNCMPKDLKPVAEEKGWNLNNVQIELYQWRKFMGLSKPAQSPK